MDRQQQSASTRHEASEGGPDQLATVQSPNEQTSFVKAIIDHP
jgi:hypothetical protein